MHEDGRRRGREREADSLLSRELYKGPDPTLGS